MGSYFNRERFGRPQFLAASILLAFFAQAVWLVHAELSTPQPMDSIEAVRIREGLTQWHRQGIGGAPVIEPVDDSFARISERDESGFDTERSPLLYLVSAAPLLAWPHDLNTDSAAYWRWLPRIPFLACGVFLGASLWYVTRRLCGNLGGFIALTLYCFSPAMIQSAAAWHTEPDIAAAWGAFGTVFTAIAVAHTLYAPREVVLWNWRRIVLLGVSLAIAVGSQFSLIILIPMALAFLLYVAPIRRKAGFAIWVAACAVGFLLLSATYFFHFRILLQSVQHAHFWGFTWQGLVTPGLYKYAALQIGRGCPAFIIILPVTAMTYLAWRRAQYFGNTAPLLVAAVFTVLAIANPYGASAGFLLAATPFLFIFVSGVLADLLETKYRPAILASVLALLIAYIARTVLALAQLPPG